MNPVRGPVKSRRMRCDCCRQWNVLFPLFIMKWLHMFLPGHSFSTLNVDSAVVVDVAHGNLVHMQIATGVWPGLRTRYGGLQWRLQVPSTNEAFHRLR